MLNEIDQRTLQDPTVNTVACNYSVGSYREQRKPQVDSNWSLQRNVNRPVMAKIPHQTFRAVASDENPSLGSLASGRASVSREQYARGPHPTGVGQWAEDGVHVILSFGVQELSQDLESSHRAIGTGT